MRFPHCTTVYYQNKKSDWLRKISQFLGNSYIIIYNGKWYLHVTWYYSSNKDKHTEHRASSISSP